MDPATVKLTHLKPADYKTMPWKNGGGTTTELMAERNGATEGYDWRLSIASVAASGPFSDFSGYDRSIMLVEGKGFTLDFAEDGTHHLTRSFEPLCFDGAWRTECTLIDGPVKDFNLIARKNVHAVLDVLRVAPGAETIAAAPTTVLHLFHGQVTVAECSLVAGDSLRIDGAVGPVELLATRPSILAAIRIGGAA
jgi:environmental stress-induced protein Ves